MNFIFLRLLPELQSQLFFPRMKFLIFIESRTKMKMKVTFLLIRNKIILIIVVHRFSPKF